MTEPSCHNWYTPGSSGAAAIRTPENGNCFAVVIGRWILAAKEKSAAEVAAGLEARRVPQLLVQLALALGERAGQRDAEHRVKVARAAAGLGQALAGEAQLLPA